MDWPLDAQTTADVIGGVLGGAIRWAALKQVWKDGLRSMFVGPIMAFYFAPLGRAMVGPMLAVALGTTAPTRLGIGGFVVGLCGIFLIDGILKLAGNKFNQKAD